MIDPATGHIAREALVQFAATFGPFAKDQLRRMFWDPWNSRLGFVDEQGRPSEVHHPDDPSEIIGAVTPLHVDDPRYRIDFRSRLRPRTGVRPPRERL